MKKGGLLILVAMVFTGLPVSGEVVFSDNFDDYPANQLLDSCLKWIAPRNAAGSRNSAYISQGSGVLVPNQTSLGGSNGSRTTVKQERNNAGATPEVDLSRGAVSFGGTANYMDVNTPTFFTLTQDGNYQSKGLSVLVGYGCELSDPRRYAYVYSGSKLLFEYHGEVNSEATIRMDIDATNVSFYYTGTAAVNPNSLGINDRVFTGPHGLTGGNFLVGLGNWAEGGSFKYTCFDNIILTQVPEPVTAIILSLGGVLIARRRVRVHH